MVCLTGTNTQDMPFHRVPFLLSLVIGEGEPVPSNQANVISLKSALKDPAFVNRIQNLEDRRQDIYIKMLKKRGQLVENEDGSQTIVSYPKVKFMT